MGRALSAENEPAKGNEVIICWICLQMSLNLITLCRIMMEEKEREGEKKRLISLTPRSSLILCPQRMAFPGFRGF